MQYAVDESNGQTLHVPPPARELPRRMETFLAFANDKGTDKAEYRIAKGTVLGDMPRNF